MDGYLRGSVSDSPVTPVLSLWEGQEARAR
jgi:hypothetical protein